MPQYGNDEEQVLQIVERSKLGGVVIPFVPEYFMPVDLGMEALILESLRIGSHPTLEPSKPFYKSEELVVRLIKSEGSFILSIQNTGPVPIKVCYSQAMQIKYGDRFSSLIRLRGVSKKNL
jgi:hypothetical protein